MAIAPPTTSPSFTNGEDIPTVIDKCFCVRVLVRMESMKLAGILPLSRFETQTNHRKFSVSTPPENSPNMVAGSRVFMSGNHAMNVRLLLTHDDTIDVVRL
jgi:hypothetical protein